MKVTLAIRQLETNEVWHEVMELEEEPLADILAEYDIHEEFSIAEQEILKGELIKKAAQAEIREAARWAQEEHDPILLSIPRRRTPSPRTLELQHRTWKDNMSKNRGTTTWDRNQALMKIITN